MDLVDLSCADFVDILSSKAPVPGGGGAAALVGAIGMALGNMVGKFNTWKKEVCPCSG
jgi:formiminotetrahydrofolate cyclodeaminase